MLVMINRLSRSTFLTMNLHTQYWCNWSVFTDCRLWSLIYECFVSFFHECHTTSTKKGHRCFCFMEEVLKGFCATECHFRANSKIINIWIESHWSSVPGLYVLIDSRNRFFGEKSGTFNIQCYPNIFKNAPSIILRSSFKCSGKI